MRQFPPLISATCIVCAACVLALALTVAGCDRHEATATAQHEQRIVSLAPGLTQMLVDLGAADRLVGVAEHDAAAPEGLPIVGHFVDVDTETLLSLRPTHVLTMSTTQEPPARLRDMAAAGQFELVAYPYPNSIDQALATLHRAPVPLGAVLEMPERTAALEQQIRKQLDRIRELTAAHASNPPRVLMIIGTRTIMASGPNTVLDELLHIAGGRNAAAGASVSAPTYDREALVGLEPDVILMLLPHGPPLSENDPRLAELRGLPIPAVRHERIHLIDDPLVLLPSTNLPRIAVTLAAVIHPTLASQLDGALREDGGAGAGAPSGAETEAETRGGDAVGFHGESER